MISLVPTQLRDVAPTAAPSPAPTAIQKVRVQAMSLRDALFVGIVTGFAYSVGALLFNKLSKRMKW